MTTLTRRAFLELAAGQSLAASVAATALLAACRATADGSSALRLDRPSMDAFIALIDEIIPASDKMPAASQAGTLAYLELLAAEDSQLPDTIHGALSAVGTLAQTRFGSGFTKVASTARTAVVVALAEADEGLFARLRTYVYEGYYLQPEVWNLLGYQPFPTSGPGPLLAPFAPELLQRVRAMPRRYREV